MIPRPGFAIRRVLGFWPRAHDGGCIIGLRQRSLSANHDGALGLRARPSPSAHCFAIIPRPLNHLRRALARTGTTMKTSHSRWLIVTAALLLCLRPHVAAQRTIDEFFRQFSEEWVHASPNLAVSTRYFTGDEQDRLDRQLTSFTREFRAQRVELAKKGLAELKRFDQRQMTESQRISAKVLAWQLQNGIDNEEYRDFRFPLEQVNGTNVTLVNALTVQQPIRNFRDAENYVARLGQVGERMRESIADAERLAANRLLPPRFIVSSTIRQMEQFVSTPAAQNPYVTALSAKAVAANLAEEELKKVRAEAIRVIESDVYPAWRSAIAFLNTLLPRTTDDPGLSRVKGGDRAYRHFLRTMTTTDLSPDQVHQIGLREVNRIQEEMEKVFSKLGRTSGTLNERLAHVKKEGAYPNTADGRKKIMDDIAGFIRDAQQRATELFVRVPKESVVAEPYPAFQEASASGSYFPPPSDGSRPGIFRIPLRDEYFRRDRLRTLIYHETIPGHHFQIALEVENSELPRFRQSRVFGIISALNEGWGLYAERLAVEAGWYGDDLVGRLGQLDAELFRAKRLVVDTGLHTKRWTRQQAIDYGIEAAEVDRYVVNPGQACAYMIGQLKILELRDKARKALGHRYTDRAFHDVVLSTGTVPLVVLEEQVDRYIKAAN